MNPYVHFKNFKQNHCPLFFVITDAVVKTRIRTVSLMIGGAFSERTTSRHPVGGFSLKGGRRLVTGSGIQPSKAGLSLATSFRNTGIYGCQRDESVQCMLPASLHYHGGACGVSRLFWESTLLAQRWNSIARWYTCFTVIGLDLFYMCWVYWSRLSHWANLLVSICCVSLLSN